MAEKKKTVDNPVETEPVEKKTRKRIPKEDKIAQVKAKIDYHKACIEKLEKTLNNLQKSENIAKKAELLAMVEDLTPDQLAELLKAKVNNEPNT